MSQDHQSVSQGHSEKRIATTLAALDEEVEHAASPQGEHHNRFGILGIIGLSYAVLNSPTAMSASLSVVLTSGGPTSVIWGVLVSMCGVLCIAASMAECLVVCPTSGGPYHWAFRFAPASQAKALAYFSGWISCAGWITLTATTSSLAGTLIVGAIALWHEDYESQPYQIFLIYVGFAIAGWFVNVFGEKLLNVINKAALFWSLAGVIVIMITTLSTASGSYQPGHFVFTEFINETGWPSGVAWILGLLQSTFGLVGLDAVTHLVHELPDPIRDAPKAMMLAPIIGGLSALVVLITYLFVLKDFEEVVSSSSGPLLTILYQATSSRAGATALYSFPVMSMMFAAIAILCASSRMVQAFARDRGLPFSRQLSSESARFGTPVWAITFCSVWVVIFGLIFLGSSTALNSILSTSVVLLQVSYSIPILCLLIRGRGLLDEAADGKPRTFKLGKWGYPINIFGVIYQLLTAVFFFFPSELPTSGSTMNYVIVVVAIVLMLATASWFFDGRRNYQGPLDISHTLEVRQAREAAIRSRGETALDSTTAAMQEKPPKA